MLKPKYLNIYFLIGFGPRPVFFNWVIGLLFYWVTGWRKLSDISIKSFNMCQRTHSKAAGCLQLWATTKKIRRFWPTSPQNTGSLTNESLKDSFTNPKFLMLRVLLRECNLQGKLCTDPVASAEWPWHAPPIESLFPASCLRRLCFNWNRPVGISCRISSCESLISLLDVRQILIGFPIFSFASVDGNKKSPRECFFAVTRDHGHL